MSKTTRLGVGKATSRIFHGWAWLIAQLAWARILQPVSSASQTIPQNLSWICGQTLIGLLKISTLKV